MNDQASRIAALLDPRRRVLALRTVAAWVHRRDGSVHGLADAPLPRGRGPKVGIAADHVRNRRPRRAPRAGARAPRGLPRLGAGADRQGWRGNSEWGGRNLVVGWLMHSLSL